MLRETDVQIYVIGFVGDLSKEAGFISKSPQGKAKGLSSTAGDRNRRQSLFPERRQRASLDRKGHRKRTAYPVFDRIYPDQRPQGRNLPEHKGLDPRRPEQPKTHPHHQSRPNRRNTRPARKIRHPNKAGKLRLRAVKIARA